MNNIVEKLQEKRNIEVAKSIMESAGYKVASKISPRRKLKESKWDKDGDEFFISLGQGKVGYVGPTDDGDDYYASIYYEEDDRVIIESDGFDTPEEAQEWVEANSKGVRESKRTPRRKLKESKRTPRRRMKESIAFPGKDATPPVVSYYTISIDAATNAPGTKYTDYTKRMSVGKNILKSAGISDSNIEVDQLGYDDISFIVKSSDRRYVDKLARKISAEAEEPSENSRLDYDQPEGAVVTIVGPYHNEDFDPDEDTDVWYH